MVRELEHMGQRVTVGRRWKVCTVYRVGRWEMEDRWMEMGTENGEGRTETATDRWPMTAFLPLMNHELNTKI